MHWLSWSNSNISKILFTVLSLWSPQLWTNLFSHNFSDHHSAYNLLRIRKGDECKMAFSTTSGHCEYFIMLYGLSCTLTVFQCLINYILREKQGKFRVMLTKYSATSVFVNFSYRHFRLSSIFSAKNLSRFSSVASDFVAVPTWSHCVVPCCESITPRV